MALAVALALTAVATFAVVAMGQEVGLFGGNATEAEAEVPMDPTATAPPLDPTITTEYIYIDGTPVPRAQATQQPVANTSTNDGAPSGSGFVDAGDDSSDDLEEHDDGEHEDGEHEDGEHEDGEHHDGEHEQEDD
jgi:hypothetical protein